MECVSRSIDANIAATVAPLGGLLIAELQSDIRGRISLSWR